MYGSQVLFLASIAIISSFFFLSILPQCHGNIKDVCSSPYSCGTLTNISFPFWGQNRSRDCGRDGFELKCHENNYTSLLLGSQNFSVLAINETANTVRLVRTDLAYDHCSSSELTNTSLNSTLFSYLPTVQNLTIFYDCPTQVSVGRSNFTCQETTGKLAFYADESLLQQFPILQKCGFRIQVPILRDITLDTEGGIDALKKALNQGFDLHYILYCTGCSPPHNLPSVKLNVGYIAAGIGAVLICITLFCFRRKLLQIISRHIRKTILEKDIIYIGVQVFSYSELKEATGNFDSASELGHGGFGAVFGGKLRDGRAVAIKRLYENNNKRVKQFLNEVKIISKLHHQNLVSLYGCTSHHNNELLLVYEFIPNGTLADHLHGQKSKPGKLPWPTRMNIATEIAAALVYLHASNVIHRDIKTSNILLDNNFSVKVADFGLSRLFPEDGSHVSTDPKGTPGYLDPEYYKFYQLTEKSDVYSFGVVLFELISSKPAVDAGRHGEKINLVMMAVNKIQNQALHELVDPCIGFESDKEIRETMTSVAEMAFRCVQGEKDFRPSMAEVLEFLERIRKGEIETPTVK